MINLIVTENQAGQRLDRFLKKYFDNASLSHIYKLIRKDVRVNGRRCGEETILQPGDEIAVYIGEDEAAGMQKPKNTVRAKKQFRVIYEDADVLIADKPFGLLTHGDKYEKKDHLTNQVIDYLIEKGEYDPRVEHTFTPASAGRLDRNTTGLVMFGKTAPALRGLNQLLREKDAIGKYYLTIVAGRVDHQLRLEDRMTKDESRNMVSAVPMEEEGKVMETVIRPLEHAVFNGRPYTLIEAELITGRTHQIRVQLSKAGFPVIGDSKYGSAGVNRAVEESCGLHTHLLHAWRLCFGDIGDVSALAGLSGREISAPLPDDFRRIRGILFGKRDMNIGDRRQ